MKSPLTDRELEVFVYARDFHRENDQIPPQAAVGRHFDCAQSTAAYWLHQLEKKGYLEKNVVGKYRFARQGAGA